jgi:enoyl-CoA hydratase
LARVIGIYRAKEVSLTGNYLPAEQAAAWGLVNRVVAPEDLLPVCRALALDMMSCVPDVMRAYKRLIDEGYAGTFTEGLALESRAANEQVRQVSPADIAARRAAIQVRGRQQAG